MKNIKFSRLFAAFAFVACLALTACQQQPEEPKNSIKGTWVSASSTWTEKWVISDSELKNYGNNNLCYAGDSVVIKELSNTSGIIYIKYTRAINADWSYSETAPDVGKWYALKYSDLTDKSVKISGAYKVGGQTSCATLEAAKQEFTTDNKYFESGSACTKQ